MVYSNKYLILFITFTSLLISGCSSNIQSNTAQNIPSWYLNAPNNNVVYLYGAGVGSTLDESKNMALNNLASKLSVNVSSVINTYKDSSSSSHTDASYSKDISQNVSVEVEKMRFANFHVEKSLQNGADFFTLIKINRNKLFEENYKEFDILDSRINKKLDIIKTKPLLEQIQALQNLYTKLNRAKKDAFVLYTISNDFDYSKYVTTYDNSIEAIGILKDRVSIHVSSNEKSKFFFNELIQLLNQNAYKTSNQDNNQNNNMQIKIHNNTRYSVARGWQIAKVTTTITTLSNDKTIATTTINSLGRSTSSQQNALAGAAVHFKKQLHKKGLDNIIFSQ